MGKEGYHKLNVESTKVRPVRAGVLSVLVSHGGLWGSPPTASSFLLKYTIDNSTPNQTIVLQCVTVPTATQLSDQRRWPRFLPAADFALTASLPLVLELPPSIGQLGVNHPMCAPAGLHHSSFPSQSLTLPQILAKAWGAVSTIPLLDSDPSCNRRHRPESQPRTP